MTLGKTLNNLRKTKESYFHLERGTMINIDLLKKGLMVYYCTNFNPPYNYHYHYHNFKIINTYLELEHNKRYYKLSNKKNNITETDYIPYVMKDYDYEHKNWIIKLCN